MFFKIQRLIFSEFSGYRVIGLNVFENVPAAIIKQHSHPFPTRPLSDLAAVVLLMLMLTTEAVFCRVLVLQDTVWTNSGHIRSRRRLLLASMISV